MLYNLGGAGDKKKKVHSKRLINISEISRKDKQKFGQTHTQSLCPCPPTPTLLTTTLGFL